MEIKIKIESDTSVSDALKMSGEVIKLFPNTPLNQYQIIQVSNSNTEKLVNLCRTKTGYIIKIE